MCKREREQKNMKDIFVSRLDLSQLCVVLHTHFFYYTYKLIYTKQQSDTSNLKEFKNPFQKYQQRLKEMIGAEPLTAKAYAPFGQVRHQSHTHTHTPYIFSCATRAGCGVLIERKNDRSESG